MSKTLLERAVTPTDLPDIAGGMVFTADECRWINDRLASEKAELACAVAAIKEERERVGELKAKLHKATNTILAKQLALDVVKAKLREAEGKVAMLTTGLDEYWVTTPEGKAALSATTADVKAYNNRIKAEALREVARNNEYLLRGDLERMAQELEASK